MTSIGPVYCIVTLAFYAVSVLCAPRRVTGGERDSRVPARASEYPGFPLWCCDARESVSRSSGRGDKSVRRAGAAIEMISGGGDGDGGGFRKATRGMDGRYVTFTFRLTDASRWDRRDCVMEWTPSPQHQYWRADDR